jgi:hypothetical protein
MFGKRKQIAWGDRVSLQLRGDIILEHLHRCEISEQEGQRIPVPTSGLGRSGRITRHSEIRPAIAGRAGEIPCEALFLGCRSFGLVEYGGPIEKPTDIAT